MSEMIPITSDQMSELCQRVVRIEAYCETRCADAHATRDEFRGELVLLRSEVERGQERLEGKLDAAISRLEARQETATKELTESQHKLREEQWSDRLKNVGGGAAGGGVVAAVAWVVQRLIGGGN